MDPRKNREKNGAGTMSGLGEGGGGVCKELGPTTTRNIKSAFGSPHHQRLPGQESGWGG